MDAGSVVALQIVCIMHCKAFDAVFHMQQIVRKVLEVQQDLNM